MKRTAMLPVALVIGALLVPTAGFGQVDSTTARTMVMGRESQVGVNGSRVSGELLAISPDTLWMLLPTRAIRSIPLRSVNQVRITRHGMGGKKSLVWSLIGGGISGAALTGACLTVDGDPGCFAVLSATAVAWTAVGGILGWALARTSHQDLPVMELSIRPYVRFPQGLPEGFTP